VTEDAATGPDGACLRCVNFRDNSLVVGRVAGERWLSGCGRDRRVEKDVLEAGERVDVVGDCFDAILFLDDAT